MGQLIYDLSARLSGLSDSGVSDRLAAACEVLPDVGVVALNGVPFLGDPPTYFGGPVTSEDVARQLRLALGFGGVLTTMNRGQLSLEQLADHALGAGHDWCLHAVNVTVCFAGCPTFVELSFARDARFHLAWVEPRASTDWNQPRVFTATASLKRWKKYLANRTSPDFLKTQQGWLTKTHQVLAPLFQDYFDPPKPQQHFLQELRAHREFLAGLALEARLVVDIGMGHGELTGLLLDCGAQVIGFELDPNLPQLEHPALEVVLGDIRKLEHRVPRGCAVVANPPYDLLPWLWQMFERRGIHDLVVMVPADWQLEAGCRVAFEVEGDAFEPPSKGRHRVVVRGFT